MCLFTKMIELLLGDTEFLSQISVFFKKKYKGIPNVFSSKKITMNKKTRYILYDIFFYYRMKFFKKYLDDDILERFKLTLVNP
jgi:hypothetical protein